MVAGVTYRFTVRARNDAGLGDASASFSIQAATPPSAPETPTVVFQNEQTIEIAWTAPGDDGASTILEYVIYWDQGSGNYVPLATTEASTFDYARTTGLTKGDLYAFKVAAVNAIGEGNQSEPALAVLAARVPDAPSGLSKISTSAEHITF